MSAMPDPRFELRKVTETEWVVLDHRYEDHDARQTVACVYQMDVTEVEVLWLRDLPLASFYGSAFEVLEDLRRFSLPARAKAPTPIRHMPPLATTA
jgi:hypothetical protein